jgi:hypothetical protein
MDGTSRVSKQWLRRVAVVTVAGLSGGGLLVLEHGTGGATGQPSQVRPNAQTPAPAALSKPTTSTSTPRHCDDGHGSDSEQNKHCRLSSGVI